VVDGRTLRQSVRERTVEEMVAAAEQAGGEVRRSGTAAGLGLPLPDSPKLREPPFAAVRVAPGITHTIGGIRIDERARVLDERGRPLPRLLAAGADAGGISAGGYASGLAAALVFGRLAAETALAP
jgi:succinate dehydrogenase/fumarate reductase flavoprotein subunit